MKNRLLLLWLVFINPLFLLSQNNYVITGRILDASTNKPIPFASIYYKYGGTIAGEFGVFRTIDTYASDTLRISCIGYKTKYVAVANLMTDEFIEISLDEHIYDLTEIRVKGKKKRIGSIQIIQNALNRILFNYPLTLVMYHGYYREYLMQNEKYFNLLETIINLEDCGFGSPDKFNAQILFKRQNRNFEIKETALIPYDNYHLKTVPESVMPELCNELLILRIHDPIRRSDYFSLSYIDTMQKNFIRNHHFQKPEIVTLDNKPIYKIEFKNSKIIHGKEAAVFTRGEIYIDTKNWGIHKIIYKVIPNEWEPDNKIYELNLSYQQIRNHYYLQYISFNNKFLLEDQDKLFKINEIFIEKNFFITVIMNKHVDLNKNKPTKANKYTIKYYDREFKVDEVRISDNEIKLYSDAFVSEVLKNYYYNVNEVSVNIENIYDVLGSKINERHFETFYQYREFFVKNSSENYKALNPEKNFNPNLPMSKNPMIYKNYSDTTWMNTPLMNKKIVVK